MSESKPTTEPSKPLDARSTTPAAIPTEEQALARFRAIQQKADEPEDPLRRQKDDHDG